MTEHVGYDHLSGYRFRIAEIDTDTHSVAIQYDETLWLPGVAPTDRLSWNEFLQQLMLGHFEIRPVNRPSDE